MSNAAGPTFGFDLDMTLIDSRPGIAATYRALSVQTGVDIDVDLAVARLGPPLEQELRHWYPARDVPEVIARYRTLYRYHAIAPTVPLPGAFDAVAAVRERGGRVLVVTAKRGDLAVLHLEHLGLKVDGVVGLAWADGKARALRAAGAVGYAGDHEADMAAARAAGIPGVGVTTGPCGAQELLAAGASVVLAELTEFRTWWDGYELGAVAPCD
jgi:phosphoglycolate phosphatase